MFDRQESSLLTEMERVKSLMKLSPEERKKEVRRQTSVELKALEMGRRQRVALEAMQKCEMEREERQKAKEERMRLEAKQREEEERRAYEIKALEKSKEDQLKKEKLQWQKTMMVEEELVKRPRYIVSALKKEQQRRREEAELCCLSKMGHKASPECLISDLKPEQQDKKKPLYNNWVGEKKTDTEPVKEKSHPNSSTYLLFAAKPGPKSEEKPKELTPNETLQWLQDRLNIEYLVDKYRGCRERKDEKRELKAEEQYARWTAFKASRASQFSQQHDHYTGGFASGRNSILKSIF